MGTSFLSTTATGCVIFGKVASRRLREPPNTRALSRRAPSATLVLLRRHCTSHATALPMLSSGSRSLMPLRRLNAPRGRLVFGMPVLHRTIRASLMLPRSSKTSLGMMGAHRSAMLTISWWNGAGKIVWSSLVMVLALTRARSWLVLAAAPTLANRTRSTSLLP